MCHVNVTQGKDRQGLEELPRSLFQAEDYGGFVGPVGGVCLMCNQGFPVDASVQQHIVSVCKYEPA